MGRSVVLEPRGSASRPWIRRSAETPVGTPRDGLSDADLPG